jgi:hypothetical protein
MKEVAPAVINGVTEVLEDRAVRADTVTRHGLREMLTDTVNGLLDARGLTRLTELLESLPDELRRRDGAAAPDAAAAAAVGGRHAMHEWGGRLHPVPQSFQLPSGSTRAAFLEYCCGNAELCYPPLRLLTPLDMPTLNVRKRWSDYLFLMRKVEVLLKQRGAWLPMPTADQAGRMFDAAADAVGVPATTTKNRKRRTQQLQWPTVASLLRGKRHHASAVGGGRDGDGDGE